MRVYRFPPLFRVRFFEIHPHDFDRSDINPMIPINKGGRYAREGDMHGRRHSGPLITRFGTRLDNRPISISDASIWSTQIHRRSPPIHDEYKIQVRQNAGFLGRYVSRFWRWRAVIYLRIIMIYLPQIDTEKISLIHVFVIYRSLAELQAYQFS